VHFSASLKKVVGNTDPFISFISVEQRPMWRISTKSSRMERASITLLKTQLDGFANELRVSERAVVVLITKLLKIG